MIDEIKNNFLAVFPNGHFRHSAVTMLGGRRCDFLIFGLISDENDCPNGIRENDRMNTILKLTPTGIEKTAGALLWIKAPTGSYLVMESLKLGFRACNGSEDKIINHLDKFWRKAGKIVLDNRDNIYRVNEIPDKYFLINP